MNAPAFLFFSADAEATRLALSLLIVFGSALLLAELFEALRQPGIVGQIVAGVLIGPSALGWIQPNEVLHVLAELGVLFLLFRVGLEVKSSELVTVGPTALLVAVLGVAAPFLAGWLILRAWGATQIESIFVGAAMVATSVGITAQVLSAKGLLNAVASKLILAAAVIDDVLGLIVLAIVSSLAKGEVKILELALTAGLAGGFTVVVAKWGSAAVGHVVPKMEARLRVGEVQFNLAILLMFVLSVVALKAGVAAIIGAFLAGMALSETVTHRVHDLTHGVSELLTPFFLVNIGLTFNLSVFANQDTVKLALLILAAAVLSKLVGCGAGGLRLGWRNALRIGSGMVPRGEVGMVVAQLGLGLGVISQPVYGVVVFMAVTTTMAAPPLLNIAFRRRPGETME